MTTPIANTAEAKTAQALGSAKARACNTLVGIAKEGVDVHRCAAVQTLGRIGRPHDVPVLIDCLLDEDEDVRSDAAAALEKNPDPRAAPQLLENLIGDPCGSVKISALRALTAMRYEPVVPWLRRLVIARDGEVVWDDEEFFAGGWDDWVDLQLKAIEELGELRIEESVSDICAAIDDEHGQDVTEEAFKALPKLGDTGLKALVGFLDDKNVRRRRRAARILAGLPAGAANSAVTKALKDQDTEVRIQVAKVLAARNIGDPRLVPLMLLGDSASRGEVISLCGHAHPNKLEALLSDESAEVRASALAALARVSRSETGLADSTRTRLQGFVRDDIIEISKAGILAQARHYPEDWPVLAEVAAEASRPAPVRAAALKALAGLGQETALQSLIDAMADQERQVRLEAMAALARIAQESSWPNPAGEALIAALKGDLVSEPEADPEADASELAANDDQPGVEDANDHDTNAEPEITEDVFPTSTLDTILSPDGERIKIDPEANAETLLSPEDIEYLSLANKGPKKRKVTSKPTIAAHEDVPRFAARVLGDVAQADVAVALAEKLAVEDSELVMAVSDSLSRVAGSLGALPNNVQALLLESFKQQANRDIKLLQIRALGYCDKNTSVPNLLTGLEDNDSFVRAESLKSLARIGVSEPGMVRLLDDPDPAVRLVAAQVEAKSKKPETVGALVEFAYKEEGYHGREAARLLREIDVDGASDKFLSIFDQPDRRRFWQVAIQAFEELHGTQLDEDKARSTDASV